LKNIKRLAILGVLFSSSMMYGAGPVMTYPNAKTDTLWRPMPAPPAIGKAGSKVADPQFGGNILRVTDSTSLVGSNVVAGDSFHVPSAGYDNPISADSKHFLITGQVQMLMSFDETTFTATCVRASNGDCSGLPLTNASFSHQQADVIFGRYRDSNLHQWLASANISTGAITKIFDATAVMSPLLSNGYLINIRSSGDDDSFSIIWGVSQNTYPYIVTYKRSTNTHHIVDTTKSTLDGKPTPIHLGFGMHEATLSLDGLYVALLPGNCYTGPCPSRPFWSLADNKMYDQKESGGHFVLGYGYFINQGMIVGSNENAPQVLERLMTAAGINSPWELSAPAPLNNDYFFEDSHLSWANAQPNIRPPVLVSYDYDNFTQPYTPNSTSWKYDGEIVAVETDGLAKKTWRFAHSFTDDQMGQSGTAFWNASRGNVSPDGKFYIYNSNWMGALGVDPTGKVRQDVFIVDLLSAH
jgi:hypothetical protein